MNTERKMKMKTKRRGIEREEKTESNRRSGEVALVGEGRACGSR
jgi:hypothetical protein